MKKNRQEKLKRQAKEMNVEKNCLRSRECYPRLDQSFLKLSNPNLSSLGDVEYLEAVLSHYAGAMFPLSDEPPKIDIHACDIEDDSMLHYACRGGDLRAVRLLVEAGADINVLGDMDQTPLHCAAAYRFLDIVKFLISKGAVQRKDAFGYTPLEWAQQMGYSDIAEVLRDNENINEDFV
ncbi:MAG: ankyrin repeat domain-containing protein [Candidatus Omnitrophota bacterium]